jgi:hypothetical protein
MTAHVDETTVRQFIAIISTHVTQVVNGVSPAGCLQLCRISPFDENSVVPSRFRISDIENMVKVAVGGAIAGHNVYIETRTVGDHVHGNRRGALEDTAWVFGLVADCDSDKGRGGNITVKPTLAIETSPGNFHLWYLFTRAITAAEAKLIGDAIRASSGTDQDTGVVTQCYRVPGTPNFPSAAKRARGRTTVEPTRIFEHAGQLWNPDDLLAAFSGPSPSQPGGSPEPSPDPDEATLPHDLLEIIRQGGDPNVDRSALFHSVISQLARRGWSVEAIAALFEKYRNGIAEKYAGRLRKEVERSFAKVCATMAPAVSANAASAGAASAGPAPTAVPHVLPTIRIASGQLTRAVAEAEQALLASGSPIFARAGTLVLPVSELVSATGGRRTRIARLRTFCVDSLMEWVADSAIFQRYDERRKRWVDIDPPHHLVKMLLVREGRWTIPRINGVLTTPTLRPDGTLFVKPGFDSRTELYLVPGGLALSPIPDQPTREQAQEALALLLDLFREFPFVGALDRAVALSALLTTLVRGSIPVAPLFLVRAHTPGVGKSYLNDVIAAVAIGDPCPAITTTSTEEMEKRLGAILLGGDQLVSLDNCTHDLGGELLCQVVERPVVKIRVLGLSAMPRCDCRITILGTGNNIALKGDMVRRGLICNLDALSERPELRSFERDTIGLAMDNRDRYVAAALTIIRGYLAAGEPPVCGPIGSYAGWSRMVRAPLVWLGQPDPIVSMETAREEDPELANIREFFDLWLAYLDLDQDYTTAQIIETACAPPAPNDYNPPAFREFLLRVAASRKDNETVSADRLGWWLRRISGRVVNRHRLVMGRLNQARVCFRLLKAE